MNSVLLMEWNEKSPSLWDLENLFMFGAKGTENPKKLQQPDWGIEGERGMNSESFYSTGGDGGSGVSGSDLGDGSSKSSKSASINSSVGFDGFPKDFIDIKESAKAEALGSSPTQEVSAGSGEPLLSLKLGKRMYFGDVCAGNTPKSSSLSVISTSIATKAKRFKSTGQSICAPRCQVEGCNIDLLSAKDYHRKHRICASHSKSPKVIVDGVELRFCQQCSRFHGLSEFDEKKRSCRRRLFDHNARRRKPQTEAMRNPAGLCSLLYSRDERQQMSIVLDQAPCVYTRDASNLTWDGACSFKFTQTKEYLPKPAKGGSTARQLNFCNNEIPSSVTMLYHDSSRPPSKGTAAKVLNRGAEESMISFNQDAPQDIHRALSLLSTSSWLSSEARPVSLDNINHNCHNNIPQPGMHAITQGLPVSSEYWQNGHPSLYTHASHSHGNDSNHFQDLHQLKGYEFGYHTNQFN